MTAPAASFDAQFGQTVCGIDEAGRGPWAGPVVAAAVIWPQGAALPAALNDSKKLTAKKREALFEYICEKAHYGIGQASAAEIDRINILQATFLAMQRAFANLTSPPPAGGTEGGLSSLDFAPHLTSPRKQGEEFKIDIVLIDGNKTPKLPCPAKAIIKGDSLSPSIAAASILAKVTRDRLMAELSTSHPEYGFERHSGYGTAQHIEALERCGVSEHHRKSYAPIRRLLETAA